MPSRPVLALVWAALALFTHGAAMRDELSVRDIGADDKKLSPLDVAEKTCSQAWNVAKTQCGSVKTTAGISTTTMDDLRQAIVAAGTVVTNEIKVDEQQANVTAQGNATVDIAAMQKEIQYVAHASAKELSDESRMGQLGETVDLTAGDTPSQDESKQKKVLAAIACETLFRQVKTLCEQVENSAERSHTAPEAGGSQMNAAINKEAEAFTALTSKISGGGERQDVTSYDDEVVAAVLSQL